MKLPSRLDVRTFFTMAAVQLFIYFLYSVNARALAQGRTQWTFWSDLVYATVSYYIIRFVAENKNRWGQAGYVLGGAWGSVLAIHLTRWLFGQ